MSTIIGFGGLFDDVGNWLNRGLLNTLRLKYPKFQIVRYSWTDNIGAYPGKVIVIGHSFGGETATAYAAKWGAHHLLTLDRRNPKYMGWPKGWSSPVGVPSTNIFETGDWLCPGASVSGASNIQITDGTGHIALPWHPTVHEIVDEIIEGKR